MQLLKDILLAQKGAAASDNPGPEEDAHAELKDPGAAKPDEASPSHEQQVEPEQPTAHGHVAGDGDETLPMPGADEQDSTGWPPKPWIPKSDVRRWMGYRSSSSVSLEEPMLRLHVRFQYISINRYHDCLMVFVLVLMSYVRAGWNTRCSSLWRSRCGLCRPSPSGLLYSSLIKSFSVCGGCIKWRGGWQRQACR